MNKIEQDCLAEAIQKVTGSGGDAGTITRVLREYSRLMTESHDRASLRFLEGMNRAVQVGMTRQENN